MKTAEESISKMIENQHRFKFKMASGQEASLKAWEEENEEYASWNLILDKEDSISCWSKEASNGAFFMVDLIPEKYC